MSVADVLSTASLIRQHGRVMNAGQLSRSADGDRAVPLCVDLDGTLIKTDLFWESSVLLLRRNPLWLFVLPFWWMKGRAHLKRQIAARSGQLDPARLPYNESFLEFAVPSP